MYKLRYNFFYDPIKEHYLYWGGVVCIIFVLMCVPVELFAQIKLNPEVKDRMDRAKDARAASLEQKRALISKYDADIANIRRITNDRAAEIRQRANEQIKALYADQVEKIKEKHQKLQDDKMDLRDSLNEQLYKIRSN